MMLYLLLVANTVIQIRKIYFHTVYYCTSVASYVGYNRHFVIQIGILNRLSADDAIWHSGGITQLE